MRNRILLGFALALIMSSIANAEKPVAVEVPCELLEQRFPDYELRGKPWAEFAPGRCIAPKSLVETPKRAGTLSIRKHRTPKRPLSPVFWPVPNAWGV